MRTARVVFSLLVWLATGPALAQGKDAAQCAATMDEYVQRLELYAAGVEEVIPLLADAQRKGDEVLTAHFARLLESNRVDGVQDMLRRIEEEYASCGKGMFSAELIARVEAARPWGVAGNQPPPDIEVPPIIEVAAITSVFVPFEPGDSGSCTGPYIDLTIKLTNRGGTFPRQVDLDVRRRTWPTSDTWGYIQIGLQFTYDNGETGQQQVDVFATDLPNGVIPAGGTVTVPMRVQVLDNRKHVTITGWLDGTNLAVAENDGMRAPPFSFEADIPIWDLYTVNTQTVSHPDRFGLGKTITTVVKADIINRGGPTPGPVMGFFNVRSAVDGRTLATVDGASAGPVAGEGMIFAGKMVPAIAEPPIEVESQLMLLCPDGSPSMLADGNRTDNYRVLVEK